MGCIFMLAARVASVYFRVEYANELDMPILAPGVFKYAVYVRRTTGVTLPLIKQG